MIYTFVMLKNEIKKIDEEAIEHRRVGNEKQARYLEGQRDSCNHLLETIGALEAKIKILEISVKGRR